MASSILALCELPGGLSKYCLTSSDENPETPPKYSMTRSSTSQLCGMFCPPDMAAAVNDATACDSMSPIVFCRSCLRFADFLAFRHSGQREEVFPLSGSWNASRGKALPQSWQTRPLEAHICTVPVALPIVAPQTSGGARRTWPTHAPIRLELSPRSVPLDRPHQDPAGGRRAGGERVPQKRVRALGGGGAGGGGQAVRSASRNRRGGLRDR